ncbi:lactoylglutathione lyase [Floricoccus penangensis]|uniref:Aldoketomutase n=1 Tax=Floricoccus penangensis TaxID=1859475 RepID=A0A9Q5JHH2_9LACT|nr:VOC family protein [Floricoccus penangensis]OFI47601.1 lactoylglutathione lyase [Floricoccus penangensis]
MKMVHTCVRVVNIDKSIKFYQDAFGFEVARKLDFPEHSFSLIYLTLPGDDYELELTHNYGAEVYDIGNGYGHIAISVDDIKAQHAKHKEAGFNITEIKGLPGTDTFFYFVTDPDGYKIEVIR